MSVQSDWRLADMVVEQGGTAMDRTDILNVLRDTIEYQKQKLILNLYDQAE
jgi:hypothetical protein